MLLAVDDSVGRILETLGRAGELDDTVVVVTSDHGYFYGEHGLGGERRLAYEETARIPMLVRYPRLIAAGTEVDELVLCLDLAATLLELGDTEPIRPLHGRSFVPLVRGETPDDWRTAFLIEYYSDTVFRRIVNMGYKAVRTDRYKYIHYLELEGMDELYDLDADPYETRNIIDEPENESILKSLQKELERQLDLTS
jgi:N-acetylglucosamine-6-sulfatase